MKFISVLPLLKIVNAFFDDTLFKTTDHSVQILKLPISAAELTDESFIISNKNGRKFSCVLPEITVEKPSEETVPLETAVDTQKNESKNTKTEILKSLMKNLEPNQAPPDPLPHYKNTPDEKFEEKEFPREGCIYRDASGGGWWSYEICVNQYIRQFHWHQPAGTNTAIPKQISVIGLYEKDMDWDMFENLSSKPSTTKDLEQFSDFEKYDKKRVHIQYYDNGDLCDITGQPRKAKIIYTCKDKSIPYTMVIDMNEPSTCTYQIIIHSPAICNHYASEILSEDKKSGKKRESVAIQCQKVLSVEEYEIYEKVQERNRKAVEDKRNNLLGLGGLLGNFERVHLF